MAIGTRNGDRWSDSNDAQRVGSESQIRSTNADNGWHRGPPRCKDCAAKPFVMEESDKAV
jgi:hypothetical protein